MNYVKAEPVSIKNSPELDEKWVQQIIADDPSILGLGDLVLRDKERIQPTAGRLDLLFQDREESPRRYEVEVQLGATDPSHIVRTIEYWDIERKRYPQYDHCAVLIAEEITSRFLNVIGLFGGTIPLVAIQMNAVKVKDDITLVFTTVLDELPRGLIDEDEEKQEVVDRSYWEKNSTKATMAVIDELFGMLKSCDSALELRYNRFYVGLSRDSRTNNFVSFEPRKSGVIANIRVPQSADLDKELADAGFDLLPYSKQYRIYRIRIGQSDIEDTTKKEAILKLFAMAYRILME